MQAGVGVEDQGIRTNVVHSDDASVESNFEIKDATIEVMSD
jgi:hypothetical protein